MNLSRTVTFDTASPQEKLSMGDPVNAKPAALMKPETMYDMDGTGVGSDRCILARAVEFCRQEGVGESLGLVAGTLFGQPSGEPNKGT